MTEPATQHSDTTPLGPLFDQLVDLPPAARERALDALAVPSTVRYALERLLAADDRAHARPFLTPDQAEAIAADLVTDATPEVTPVPAAPAPRRLGRYTLLHRLGAGGMGEVHLAHDHSLARDVAVKILSPHLLQDPQWLGRFHREAHLAARLNHPNVLTVHDVGESSGTHFLVTEYVAGTTLRERLAHGPLGADEMFDVGGQILAAMASAHAAGVVHRDLKPENVMLRDDGIVKVLDFGLARPSGALASADLHGRTQAGLLLGTLRYMSPEQARGGAVDARGDVFTLGALLFEMATGRPAIDGATPLDVLVALLERTVPSLTELRPDLPAGLAALVATALAKDPAARPADAAAMLAELEALRRPAPPSTADDSVPAVRYARSGDVDIAYQVFGTGPVDLVFVMGWISHLEWFWREPSFARFLRALARSARVILFDKRGTGLSDRVATDRLPTLEQRMDDVRAVMDAVGSTRAVLCGVSEGGPMCTLFAATHPSRTAALVMIGSYARRLRSDEYPWGSTAEARERFCQEILQQWGGPVGIEERAPSKAGDPAFRSWWAAYLRHGASPNAAVALTRMNAAIDVRPVLPTVRVPTLIVHRTGDRCLSIEEGRYLAHHIPGARLVELPGQDHLPFVGDQDAVVAAIAGFLGELGRPVVAARTLATAVHVRPGAGSDATRFRRAMLGVDGLAVAHTLALADDGLVATFDGPARAVDAGLRAAAAAATAGLVVAVGVHTDECEVEQQAARGTAVEGARAVAAAAADGEVLVSATVPALTAGAGFHFVPTPPERAATGTPPTFRAERQVAADG